MFDVRLTYLCRMDSSTFTPRTIHYKYKRCLVSLYYFPCFIKSPVFNANSVDPDQTPRSAASDLGLHCLPVSLLWEGRRKWLMIGNLILFGLKMFRNKLYSIKTFLITVYD